MEPAQGALVLRVFREFPAATSMLDDFAFYGARKRRARASGASATRARRANRRRVAETRRGTPRRRTAATPSIRRGPRDSKRRSRARGPALDRRAREKPKPRADAAPFESAAGKEKSRAARTNPTTPPPTDAAAGTRTPGTRAHVGAESAVAAPAAALPPFKFGDDDRDQRAEERRSSPRARGRDEDAAEW